MKDTLTKIKNNLKGNSSGMDKAENQINDLEHKEAKQTNKNKPKTFRKTRRKKNKRKSQLRIV